MYINLTCLHPQQQSNPFSSPTTWRLMMMEIILCQELLIYDVEDAEIYLFASTTICPTIDVCQI